LNDKRQLIFGFFNEIGIIHQLSTTLLNHRLPDGLHASHFGVLGHLLKRPEGQTPLAIANAFQVTKGTMTHTLRVLEKRDLIVQVPHPKDGRSKIVKTTKEGAIFFDEARKSLAPAFERLEGKLDLDQMIAMLPALQKIREVIDSDRDSEN